jgi:NAD(P)-dependent dehydrogenase (short-subunit alcohol dehydrogenase family)
MTEVAIVTGAARGIGAASVRALVDDGYAVVATDIAEPSEDLPDAGCTFVVGDVSEEGSVERVVEVALGEHGRVDALVNVAGIVLVKPLETTTWDEYRRTVDVNLGGTFLFCKHVIPTFKAQGSGVIVNMASVSGHVGQTEHVLYGATKGAVLAFTRALAWELAPHNVRVNSISPGSVDTPMLRGDVEIEVGLTGRPFEELKKEREAEQAFNRWADPSEIATAVSFLASSKASFVTGADLLVDCGWVAK